MAARQAAVDVVSLAQDVIAEVSPTSRLGGLRKYILQYRLFRIEDSMYAAE